MTFKQTEYKGVDLKRMEKDRKKYVKYYTDRGHTQLDAEKSAAFFIDYYKHQYRVYA
ncbi:hypothetical protein MZM54_00280 [[Brevibacterium] frigoritolerans]|nr:hypothetical protein [Peribacillus frigoritolerans]